MTTDCLLARYMVITLKADSADGQDGRRYAQAGASRSLDVGGQDARRSSQRGRGSTANRIHVERRARRRWYRRASRYGHGAAGELDAAQLKGLRVAPQHGPLAHRFGPELWTLRRVWARIERLSGVAFIEVHVWR